LYPNLRPRSVISNESSFGKIGHVEQGNKQVRIWLNKYLATGIQNENEKVISLTARRYEKMYEHFYKHYKIDLRNDSIRKEDHVKSKIKLVVNN
jgi:hypothetical protein